MPVRDDKTLTRMTCDLQVALSFTFECHHLPTAVPPKKEDEEEEEEGEEEEEEEG